MPSSARAARLLVTADHGNCEMYARPSPADRTAHTTNPVPLLLIARAPRAE